MSKVKSIFKRSLAILLAMLTIMSVGLTSILAATVELAPVSANHSGGHLYFVKPSSWTNASYIVGHDSYYRVYPMTKLSGNLYYLDAPSFGGWNGWGFVDTATASTGGKVWDKYTSYPHYTALNTSYEINGNTCFCTGGSANGSGFSPTYVGGNYGSVTTYTQRAYAYYTTNGSSYTNGTTGGTVKVTTYQLSGNGTGSSASTSASSNASRNAVTGSSVTMTATAASGYTFVGWFTSTTATSATSTNTTYTYNASEAKTMYARFKSSNYTYTVTAGTGGTITSTTSGSVTPGSGVTVTAKANEGYTFTGWTSTSGSFANASALSTTFTPSKTGAVATANFAKNTYTVTFKDYDGSDLGTATVSHGGTATAPVTPSRTGYTFDGWSESLTNVTGNMTVTAQYTINTYKLTISGFDSTKAELDIDGTSYLDDDVISKTYGSTSTVTITPKEGYVLTVNGTTYDDGYSETITFDKDQTLTLGFNIKTFDVTISYVLGRPKSVIIGNTEYSTGGSSSQVQSIPYGTNTLKITALDNYYIESVVGNGVNVNYDHNGTMPDEFSFDINVTDDCTISIRTQAKPKFDIKITTITDGTTETFLDTSESYGKSYTINVPAQEGYYISRVTGTINGASVNYTSQDYSNSTFTQTIDSLTDDTELTVYYTAIPTFEVDVTSNDADAGTVTGGGTVYSGSVTNLTATVNTGYRFTGWTASNENYRIQSGTLESPSLSIIANGDVEFTANFAPVTGIINVTAGEGGTVTNAGTHNVTYPETITATATGDASQGYEFTHWTVESDGEVNVDYKVTENDDEITVQILTQDTEVNVTANFANAQKIKVYTYSDSGFNRLTMTESNGTTTNTPVNNVTQSPVTFGEETWYTPGEVTLTAGFSNIITAQMSGDNPLTSGTGTLIMFKNTLGWDTVYFYGKDTSMYKPDVDGSGDVAVSTTGVNALPMKQIGTSQYYYIFAEKNYTYKAFSEGNQGNYSWFWQTEASYPNKGNSITGSYSLSTPCFAPSTTKYWANDANSTSYYNNGSWVSAPSVATQTESITITSELYDGNAWKGVEEIWIYFKADGTYIATTKDRRELIDEVNSALMKRTYNNGVNDMEYTSSTWTAFVSAYEAAITAAGDPTLNDTQLEAKHSALTTAYNNLKTETNITITGSHGAEPKTSSSDYYGKTTFPGITTSTGSGNIGDDNSSDWYHYTNSYIYATIQRGTTITINTNLESAYEADYLVYGWVVNGTEWVPATQDIEDTSKYVGTYKCDKSATFVPIYFRKTTIANWETDDNIVKIYASTEGASSKWGNYISAYTWMNDKKYYQFGHWTGQLMIPDTANPGMYYTYLEFKDPAGTDDIAGIAFTNYGANKPINEELRYQTYDYYEFKELKSLGYNNIVFQLKTFEGNENYPSSSGADLSNYQFDYFRDFSGNMIDITRVELTDEQKALEPELYIVRTGPVAAYQGKGYRHDLIAGSDYYVDTYVYDKNGNYLVGCKSFELLDLELLAEKSGKASLASYAGKPVMVDYASLTYSGGSGENRRFDGEWYGTIYGLTNVTIKTEVAFQNEKGEIEYFQGQNNVDGVGQAYFNGEHFQEVSHGSENHTINAIVAEGNDFVGWYKAIVADDGTYTIDATAKPLFIERSVSTIDASADAVYVAVFKEHPEGTFTVNNYYYTYDDFKGQPMGEHLPPVFGGDTSYSIRDVKIQKTKNYDNSALTEKDNPGFAGTYTQSMEVAAGDELTITIRTTPTYTQRDYVYAWYIQANEADGKVNFEEVGTNVIQDNYEPGATKEFTFTYTVEPGVDTITIYSDVVHITPEVTFTYIYNNRYNETRSYVVKHTLTDAELQDFDNLKDNADFMTKIHNLAPYVGDIYKNVTWEIENISSDATNWTLRASEADVYTVNVNVNGTVMEPPVTGRFNDTVSLYAKDIDDNVTGNKGIWYLNNDDDPDFDAAVDEILGYGTYYGLVITGDADVYFTSVDELINQIILADAVYGYERATDGSGSVTTNKVYVDYLISMLLNVYTGGYIDINGNGKQDSNEPTVIDEENTNTPVSLKAISDAGYVVDYGIIHELLNTFGDNSDKILAHYYKSDYEMDNAKLTEMLKSGSGVAEGESYEGALATYFYHYSAIDYKDYATNKNRVIMTFGFDNNDFNRSMFYNVKAYLTISVPGTTTINDTNTMFVFSNQATLNIAEADKITNGEATNS